MDSFHSALEQSSRSISKDNNSTTSFMAEETATSTSMVIMATDTEPGTSQMLVVNPMAVPADTFHHRQGNFVGISGKPIHATSSPVDPTRRIYDRAEEDVPVISHIGVFAKGAGQEEAAHSKDQEGKQPSELGSNGYHLGSPVEPLPECGLKGHQVLVGEKQPGHTPHDSTVSYSQQCTEDVDSSSCYQLGKHWERGDLIGRGVSGTCYVAVDLVKGCRMVVKQISNDTSQDDVMSEIDLMQDISQKNIIQFYGATRDYGHVNIFMELMEGGSLEDRLKFGAFGEDTICRFSRQLVSGLHYLHWKGIVHRDLKGGNLLTDFAGRILKIADFGAAARLVDYRQFYSPAGTIPYMAPEVVRSKEGHGYNAKCDVWSMGCVVIEMATTRPPWVKKNSRNHRWEIFFKIGKSDAPPPIPPFYREDLRDFTIQCLRLNPEDRASSEDLLNHRLLI